LDGILVLVIDDQMYQVVSSLIPRQIPLFIEKPPGLTPDLTFKLSALAQEYNLINMVGYNRRYYSIFHKGMAKIREHGPLLGVSVEGHERMRRVREAKVPPHIIEAWLYANSTHTIDLLRFFGGEVKELSSFGYKLKEPLGDQFVASMKMSSGALGQYQAFWYSPGGWKVDLYGDGVTVEFKPLEKGQWTDADFKTHEILPDEIDVQFKPGFYAQMRAFIGLVKSKKAAWPMLDLSSAYGTMALAQKLSQSTVPFKEGA
jgi:predicted dehydrogenase